MPDSKQIVYNADDTDNWSPNPSAVQDALDQLAARPEGTSVTWQDGADTNHVLGIYGSWPEAFAAAVLQPYPRITQVGNGVIPAGAYTMPPGFLLQTANLAGITFENGSVFTVSGPCFFYISGSQIEWETTTVSHFLVVNGGYLGILANGGVSMEADEATAASFIHCESGGSVILSSGLNGVLSGNDESYLLTADAGAQVEVWLSQYSNLGSNSLSGAGDYSVIRFDPSVQASQEQGAATNVQWFVSGGTPIARVDAVCTSSEQPFNDGSAPVVVTGWTVVTNESSYDAGSFVATTGVFTCPVAGWYTPTGAVEFKAVATPSGGEFTCGVFHNGVLKRQAAVQTPTGSVAQANGVTVQYSGGSFYCNQNDTIGLVASQSNGGGHQTTLTGTPSRNWFSVTFTTS